MKTGHLSIQYAYMHLMCLQYGTHTFNCTQCSPVQRPSISHLPGNTHPSSARGEEMFWRSTIALNKLPINALDFWLYLSFVPLPTILVPPSPECLELFLGISNCFLVFISGGLGVNQSAKFIYFPVCKSLLQLSLLLCPLSLWIYSLKKNLFTVISVEFQERPITTCG